MACNRKAGFTYIAEYPDLGNADTELGTHVHAVLEDIGKTGRLPDLMEEHEAIAAEALPYVQPLIVPGVSTFEGQISLQGRHAWIGFVDVRPRPGMKIDYKTTSDFKWAKKPETLLVDPQAMLYAEHEFRAYPELEKVDLLWLYLRKRKPYAALPVEVSVQRSHAARAFAALETFADEMQAAAEAAPADPVEKHKYILTLTPNFNHCSAYRGCPHRDRCPDSPLFPPDKGTKDMDLLARLQEMNAQTANPLPEAPVLPGEPNPFVPLTPTPGGNPHPMGARTDIPENSVPAIVQTTIAPANAGAGQVQAAAINPPKRGPGRPRKNPVAQPPPAVPVAPPATSTNPADAQAAACAARAPSYPPPAPVASGGLTLYVGCVPVPMPQGAVDFDAIVAKAKDMITLPVYYANYGYKANGMVLDAVQRIVEHAKPTTIVVAHPSSPECLSYLRSVASVVVEAVR